MGKFRPKEFIPDNQPVRIAYQSYFCLLGCTLLALQIASYVLYDDAMDRYELIIENWKAEPIKSMRVSYQSCSDDEESLINYNWPGTVDGCDCRDYNRILRILQRRDLSGFRPKRKIYNNHACNFTQTSWGCVTVDEVSSKKFEFFPEPDGTFGYALCAKREANNSFYHNSPESLTCNEGQKACGTDLNYFICTKEAQCPITEISFKGFKSLEDVEEVPMKNDKVLLISRSYKQRSPLVQTRVGEGTGVCIDNHQMPITPGRQEYSLMEKNKTDCAKDNRFEVLYKVGERTYFQTNDAIDLEKQLRGFVLSQEYLWGFYYRPYILWKQECRGETLKQFKEEEERLEIIMDSQATLLIINIIFFVTISVILTIVSGLNLCGYDWPCIKGQGAEESNYIFYTEILLKTIMQVAQAAVVIWSFSHIQDEISFLEKILDKQCSDQQTQEDLHNLKVVLDENIYQFNLAQLILFIVTSILDCGTISYLTMSYLKHRRISYSMTQNPNSSYQPPGQQLEMGQINGATPINNGFQQPYTGAPYGNQYQPQGYNQPAYNQVPYNQPAYQNQFNQNPPDPSQQNYNPTNPSPYGQNNYGANPYAYGANQPAGHQGPIQPFPSS